MDINEGYKLAKCCTPVEGDSICGYHSHNMVMIVHRKGCGNLGKVEADRIVPLDWNDVIAVVDFTPESDYRQLDRLDFRILGYHRQMGVDYAHVVARALSITKAEAFERHKKLRELKLLKRVEALMIRYRKGIVDNKWIKHRNHTYYDLTGKGSKYLAYHLDHDS